jgi:hypothetical protein
MGRGRLATGQGAARVIPCTTSARGGQGFRHEDITEGRILIGGRAWSGDRRSRFRRCRLQSSGGAGLVLALSFMATGTVPYETCPRCRGTGRGYGIDGPKGSLAFETLRRAYFVVVSKHGRGGGCWPGQARHRRPLPLPARGSTFPELSPQTCKLRSRSMPGHRRLHGKY